MICKNMINKQIFKKIKENFTKNQSHCFNMCDGIYLLGLALLIFIILLFIECSHPYFFLQDDNRDYYLPYFIHNYESLFLEGNVALYNFHQFLGMPSLALGQSAALYPITYLSIFISKVVFGHYFAAIDVEVILHLIIGSLGVYSFSRILKVGHKVSLFAGLTWALSSFVIYVSNSWVVVSAAAAYFPWMLFLSFKLYKNPKTKVVIYLVAIRLLLFYAGHIQYFIYSIIFEMITMFFYLKFEPQDTEKKEKIKKFLKKYIESYIYVTILALPLLLPMWHQTTISAKRSGKLPFNVFVNQYFPKDQMMNALFFPFSPLRNYESWWTFRNMFSLSYIGYIPLLFLFVGIFVKIFGKKTEGKKSTVRLYVFIIPAVIAFLWASNVFFNLVIYIMPILNRFRWPFKLAFYLDFYLIIVSVLIFSDIASKLPWKEITKKIAFCILLILQIFNFLLLYTVSPYRDFGEHHGDKLPLEEKLQDKLKDGRIISLGFDIWKDTPGNNYPYLTAPSLGFNYATLWGLDYFAGYEPLISEKNAEAALKLNFIAIVGDDSKISADYFRKVGVKWYLVPKEKAGQYAEKLKPYGIIKKYEDETRVVFCDDKASPMIANSLGEKIESTDYKITANSIELSVDFKNPDMVVFNYLKNPFFKGYIDGKKVDLKTVNDILIGVSVPEGKHNIKIVYSDPYLFAGIYAVIAFGVFIIFAWKIKAKIRKIKDRFLLDKSRD